MQNFLNVVIICDSALWNHYSSCTKCVAHEARAVTAAVPHSARRRGYQITSPQLHNCADCAAATAAPQLAQDIPLSTRLAKHECNSTFSDSAGDANVHAGSPFQAFSVMVTIITIPCVCCIEQYLSSDLLRILPV